MVRRSPSSERFRCSSSAAGASRSGSQHLGRLTNSFANAGIGWMAASDRWHRAGGPYASHPAWCVAWWPPALTSADSLDSSERSHRTSSTATRCTRLPKRFPPVRSEFQLFCICTTWRPRVERHRSRGGFVAAELMRALPFRSPAPIRMPPAAGDRAWSTAPALCLMSRARSGNNHGRSWWAPSASLPGAREVTFLWQRLSVCHPEGGTSSFE